MGRGQAVAYDYYAQTSYDAEYWQQEAARVVEQERLRLQHEMQARLDQVGAEIELLESYNRRQVGGLRWKVFFMFLLAAAIAGAAGWMFVKKIRPKVNNLQAMLSAQQVETDRLSAQLRDQTDKARAMEEKYVAARAELDRGKKPEAPKAAVAPAAEAPKPAAPPVAQAPKPTPAPPPPAVKPARPAPPAAPPPPKKACNCAPGDPMCACL
jgi:hypothetical protein